ncbi:cupin domain-containing protein [Desulfosporosinus meridiei]|uniref:Cupin domain-containing protein n=1 Tax=Desulfosporosinus meridiei (strain ATCC BAA-275 / DSM 13257 / KCTC 12902 / NCIMB 13706 / S10) TaxID=768704 RepID=J7IZ91_DESMD|nr:cupin domain-containing protein [Desulfosporosinus meridiei]AFQ44026.1 cupin domain-containing protein [Desulfosporosinus meridiei DSM 13257]
MKIEKIADKIVYKDDNLTKKILFNESRVLNFVLNFRPGQGVPPHHHEQSDLIIHVLVGQGEMGVDGTIHEITEGDVIHCKGSEVFSLKNTGDKDMSCFVILAPNPSAAYSIEV